jgi:hypothetical protein
MGSTLNRQLQRLSDSCLPQQRALHSNVSSHSSVLQWYIPSQVAHVSHMEIQPNSQAGAMPSLSCSAIAVSAEGVGTLYLSKGKGGG